MDSLSTHHIDSSVLSPSPSNIVFLLLLLFGIQFFLGTLPQHLRVTLLIKLHETNLFSCLLTRSLKLIYQASFVCSDELFSVSFILWLAPPGLILNWEPATMRNFLLFIGFIKSLFHTFKFLPTLCSSCTLYSVESLIHSFTQTFGLAKLQGLRACLFIYYT